MLCTIWLFNIAMENGLDDFPIKTSIYKGFSMAMLNNQMVTLIYITGDIPLYIHFIHLHSTSTALPSNPHMRRPIIRPPPARANTWPAAVGRTTGTTKWPRLCVQQVGGFSGVLGPTGWVLLLPSNDGFWWWYLVYPKPNQFFLLWVSKIGNGFLVDYTGVYFNLNRGFSGR